MSNPCITPPCQYDQTITNQSEVFISEESIWKEMIELFFILVFFIVDQQQNFNGVRVNLPLVYIHFLFQKPISIELNKTILLFLSLIISEILFTFFPTFS